MNSLKTSEIELGKEQKAIANVAVSSLFGRTIEQLGEKGNGKLTMAVERHQLYCVQEDLRIAISIAAIMVIIVTKESHLVSIKVVDF